MKNMNTNKSFDMSKLINLKLVDFEKVKFDYIQKIAKKFRDHSGWYSKKKLKFEINCLL